MNGQESKTLFDVAYDGLKDAYVHTPAKTAANRILEEALNRLQNMPVEVSDRERVKLLEAEVSTLREHLAEVNRLMSLNCREVERLHARCFELRNTLRDLIEANDDYINGDVGFPFAEALEKAKAFLGGAALQSEAK